MLSWFSKKQSKVGEASPPIFRLPEGVRVYAVGDIHGRAAQLQQMLAWIEQDAKTAGDQRVMEVFLGDYIDRGADSKQVIDQLIAPSPKGHERICLMGNHEHIMLEFLEEPQLYRSWSHHGALATLMSYGVELPRDVSEDPSIIIHAQLCDLLPPAHAEWLQSLRTHYELGDYYFTHAGVNPDVPLAGQDPSDLMWIRSGFIDEENYFEKYIVHGHTPCAEPELLPNRANLDVSNADTPQLACLVLEGEERRVQVVG